MAFYFVNDGTVDTAVAFGEDDAQLVWATLAAQFYAVLTDVYPADTTPPVLQPVYAQQDPGADDLGRFTVYLSAWSYEPQPSWTLEDAQTIASADGSSVGAGAASGAALAIGTANATGAGSATVQGAAIGIASTQGLAAGSATVQALAFTIVPGIGTVTGLSIIAGQSQGISIAQATAAGIGFSLVNPLVVWQTSGVAAGMAQLVGDGQGISTVVDTPDVILAGVYRHVALPGTWRQSSVAGMFSAPAAIGGAYQRPAIAAAVTNIQIPGHWRVHE